VDNVTSLIVAHRFDIAAWRCWSTARWALGEALHLVIKRGNDHGLDDSDHSRDLRRPRDQQLFAVRVL